MSDFVDQDGWPVDLNRLPSWERRGEKVYRDNAIFKFFQCPCSRVPGGKRKPHRISTCDYVQIHGAATTDNDHDVMLAKRLRAMTAPIQSVVLR